MSGGERADVDGLDLAGGGEFLQIRHRTWSPPQEIFCLLGQRAGVIEVGIAGTDQFERGQPGAVQLGETVEMAMAHPAASDDGEG